MKRPRGTGTFEAVVTAAEQQPKRRRARPGEHRRGARRGLGRAQRRAGREHPGAPTTTSGSRSSPTPAGQSLQDHLLWQLELASLAPRELAIARAIVDAISDDGYLTESLDEIAQTLRPELECAAEEVERVLADRAGARPARRRRALGRRVHRAAAAAAGSGHARLRHRASQIARHHLELVAERELSLLRRELRTTEEEIAAALALVRSCHPRPGSTVSAGSAEYVVPDVFVRRTDHGWGVEINPATLPRVRLNQGYASLIGRNASHATMRAQLQEARWLLKSLEIRHETLMKVARSIVERQTAFLEHGEEHMRPMILKDIAEAVAMHESTISRVTSGKYMHTPRGVFELRYFFSSQVEGADGSGTSSTAIRAKIRKLIKDEDPESPLSDGRIAELLSGEGIPVARRTVAKYREAMGIAASNERRRAGSKQM